MNIIPDNNPLKQVPTFKIVILGHPGVGKTSLIKKFVDGKFHPFTR